MLGIRAARGYELIRQRVFPPGVFVKLGRKQLRFDEDALSDWVKHGGAVETNSNHESRHGAVSANERE